MKRLFLQILCILLWLTHANASVPNYDINAQCLARYGDSGSGAQMQEDCRADEKEIKIQLEHMLISEEIMQACDELARSIGGSYSALAECIKMKGRSKILPSSNKEKETVEVKDGMHESDQTDILLDARHSSQLKQTLSIPDYDIKAQCLARYGDSGSGAQMQEDCHAEEEASKERLRTKLIPKEVLQGCDELARSIGGSYTALAECVKMKMAKRPTR